MSQQDLPKVTVQNGHLMLGEKPVYMCVIHKGQGNVPFYKPDDDCSWGELASWISQWEPVLAEPNSDDENIYRDPDSKPVERPDGSHQSTFRNYQLYTYKGDTSSNEPKGEVTGFWELVSSELEDDGTIQPSNARGP